MADDDYEIDFYGDAADDQQRDQEQHHDGNHPVRDEGNHVQATHVNGNGPEGDEQMDERRHSKSTEEPGSQQGVKRKSEELDDRPVDSGATAAIMISELNWWTTDDDIRGWLRQADCEQEVKELTFSEHKVNGKSKGQAYVEFLSRQSATAAKRHIDQLGGESNQTTQKKVSTSYWNPGVNPFRTLPKDAPARVKEQPRAAPSGPFNDRGGGNGFGNGGFRGRGGMNGNRGNMGQNNFNNRNFNGGGNMGFNTNNGNNMGGGFNGPMGGGGGGGNFGFNGRGNMMGGGMGGMRGGPGGMRGGRGGNMMGGMNPMGGMPMGMPMGMMGQGMPGFQGMNPNFGGGFGFGPNQGGGGGGGDWGNPHGAKRPRPE